MNPFALLAHWLGRQFLSLLMIVAVLLTGSLLYSGIQHHLKLYEEKEHLQSSREGMANTWSHLASETETRLQAVNKNSRDALDQRTRAVTSEIANLESVRSSPAEQKLALLRGDTTDIEREIRIDLLKQERQHLELARAVLDRVEAVAKGNAQLQLLRNRHALIYRELLTIRYQIDALKIAYPLEHKIPWTSAWQDLQLLEAQEANCLQRNQQAYDAYQQQLHALNALQKLPTMLLPFAPSKNTLTSLENELQKNIQEKSAELANTLISRFINPALEILPSALVILLGTILSPVAIKAFFYYLIAPIATRCSPVRLIPDSNGIIHPANAVDSSGTMVSGKSLAVTISPNEELLVHPEYLRSMATDSVRSTQWLLDKRYPLTSLAAGLYLLTRLRANNDHTHVISAKEDILAEVALIEIPTGTKFVLQPRNVIGLVQPADQPLRIESKWRMGSVSAWLTLQLRYLVFSGPAKLFVKGCQGVRVDPVGTGQTINQAATIGFSGNLAYSVTRCDPFLAYLRGKQELFNDRFAGASGFYISEQTPNAGKKSDITGKGLEGLADSFLKVFGI